jgi:hypothetical protein
VLFSGTMFARMIAVPIALDIGTRRALPAPHAPLAIVQWPCRPRRAYCFGPVAARSEVDTKYGSTVLASGSPGRRLHLDRSDSRLWPRPCLNSI